MTASEPFATPTWSSRIAPIHGPMAFGAPGLAIELLDALPLTPVGMPDKKVLRARYWTGHARRVN